MIRAELIRSVQTGGGLLPAGELLTGADAIEQCAQGNAIPIREAAEIETAVINRKRRSRAKCGTESRG